MQGGCLGLLSGAVFFTVNLFWLTHALSAFGGLSGVLATGVLFCLTLYLSLYVGAFGACVVWIAPRSVLGRILVPPTVWTALEFLRASALTGFPWGFLAYTQATNLPLIQIAAWTGMYGVTWVLVFANSVMAVTLDRRLPSAQRAVSLVFLVATLGGVVTLGMVRLNEPESGVPVRVAALQGNVSQEAKWQPGMREATVQRYERLTREAGQARPRLMVWPETALPFPLRQDAVVRRRLEQLAREVNASLLVGSPDVTATEPPGYLNSAFYITPEDGIAARYDKIHLVPFGEYVPLRSVLGFVDKVVQGAIGDFRPGSEYSRFSLGAVQFGVTISYEVYFPAQVRRYVQGGAGFLVNITNDAWYGRTAAPFQHLAMAVFRAIENNVYLVRAANTGISAVVSPAGRVLRASQLFVEDIISYDIRAREGGTYYTRHGDVFAWLAVGGTVLTLAIAMVGRRKGTHPERAGR